MKHKPYMYFTTWRGPHRVWFADIVDRYGEDVAQVTGDSEPEVRRLARRAAEKRDAIAKERGI